MYFESLIALPAMAVWCLTEAGPVNELAYGVLFLAGVSTVIFNINPLMRYDGYYILGDLLEYPNFRQMSIKYVVHVLKRIFLGVRDDMTVTDVKTKVLLFSYGVAVSVYRVGVYLAISMILASKMFLAGLALGVTFVAVTLYSMLRKMALYLWYSPETALIRKRAVAMSIGVLVLAPVLILVLPIRNTVRPMGILETENDLIVRAKVDGFVERIPGFLDGQVQAGDPLVVLKNEVYIEDLARAEAKIQAVQIRENAYAIADPTKAVQEKRRAVAYELERKQNWEDLENLTVRAGQSGRVVSLLSSCDLGRYIRQGRPIATISSGGWTVRSLLTQEQMADSNPAPGDVVEVKIPSRPSRTFSGVITRLVPGGNHKIDAPALTKPGGGGIVYDPVTRKSDQPYYEMGVALDPAEDLSALYPGLTCQVNCRPGSDTLGTFLYRRMARFLNRTLQR
jgi:putative peptide zinc metalloprotease protein